MKFSITQPALANILEKVAKIKLKNNMNPALSGVMIRVEGAQVSFATTNLVTSIRTWTTCEDTEDGAALVPVAELLNAAKTARKNTRIDILADGQNIRFASGATKLLLHGFQVDEFPLIPQIESDESPVYIERKVLENIADRVAPFAAKDTSRAVLCCVSLAVKDGKLAAFCADGFSLAGLRIDTVLPNQNTLIDAESFQKEIVPVLIDTQIQVSTRKNSVIFRDSVVEIVTQQTEGVAPDFQMLFSPEDKIKSKTIVSARDFTDALKRLAVITESTDSPLSVSFGGEGLVLRSQGQKGVVEDSIVSEFSGDDIEVKLNLKYLQAMIGASENTVTVKMVNPSSPVNFFCSDVPGWAGVIMPIHADAKRGK